MSSDLLKRAATKLREHAQALPGTMVGPWFIRAGNVIADDGTDVGILAIAPYSDSEDGPLMAYVALMHPPVALALADWLELTAIVVHEWAATVGHSGNLTRTDEAAITLARAILREAPDAA